MILLDTQLWIWWTTAGGKLSPFHNQYIETHVPDGLAMSAFTVWEVALLEKKGRVDLGAPVAEWAREVVRLPVVHLIPLVPELLIDSVQLPEPFHPDARPRLHRQRFKRHTAVLADRGFNLMCLHDLILSSLSTAYHRYPPPRTPGSGGGAGRAANVKPPSGVAQAP